jgi:endonuclease/exonuclease/phosphatase family metal-dependent hydrolase
MNAATNESRTSSAAGLALSALVVMLGAQLIRVFIPLVGWYLRDIKALGTFDLIPFALAPFAASFLVPLIVWMLRPRASLWLAVVGLGLARIVEQALTDPAADLWVSMAGVGMFLWALPILVGFAPRTIPFGFLVGIAADTALKGATRTLDLSWIGGIWPLVVITVLVLGMLLALVKVTSAGGDAVWPGRPAARAVYVVGPLLLVEWLVLQNQGWVATATGWSSETSLLIITAGNAAALYAAGRMPASRVSVGLLSVAGGLVLAVVGLVAFELTGPLFAILMFVGIVFAGVLMAAAFAQEETFERIRPTAIMFGLGNITLVFLALVYFVSIDRDLYGLTNRRVLAVAGGFALFASLIVAFRRGYRGSEGFRWPAGLAATFIVVPLLLLGSDLVGSSPEPGLEPSVTVMSYNLHSGFDGTGRQNPEAMAQIIEASGVDVIGLQEVSRGWFLNGGTDLVTWMSSRLDMPYRSFVGAADPAWGNAILSRYPLEDIESGLLPQGLIPHQRSYQSATVDLGGGQSILLINTHLQQINDTSIPHEGREGDLAPLHLEQLGTVVEHWADRPRTILTGDLNAQPGWEQMEYLLGTGLVDALVAVDPVDAYTSGYWDNGGVPRWRVDWLVHTSDLAVVSAGAIENDTSDHYPLLAEFAVDR